MESPSAIIISLSNEKQLQGNFLMVAIYMLNIYHYLNLLMSTFNYLLKFCKVIHLVTGLIINSIFSIANEF